MDTLSAIDNHKIGKHTRCETVHWTWGSLEVVGFSANSKLALLASLLEASHSLSRLQSLPWHKTQVEQNPKNGRIFISRFAIDWWIDWWIIDEYMDWTSWLSTWTIKNLLTRRAAANFSSEDASATCQDDPHFTSYLMTWEPNSSDEKSLTLDSLWTITKPPKQPSSWSHYRREKNTSWTTWHE